MRGKGYAKGEMNMPWGWNSTTDEEADEAFDDYAQEDFEPGFNMDDGADPEPEKLEKLWVNKNL